MQAVVQLMAKQTGSVRQTPRASKLQTGRTIHMDSLPLFLNADDEIETLENLCAASCAMPCTTPCVCACTEGPFACRPMIKRLMMLQV